MIERYEQTEYMNFRTYKDPAHGMCDHGVRGCEPGTYRN